MMEPVFFADPKDMSLRAEDRAFLFGPDLLVIPPWAKDAKLPRGIWRDISITDRKREHDGYQPALKIRGGAIIPLGRVVQNTNEKSLDPLTLLVCLDEKGTAEGDLYEDAGDGFDYEKEGYALTHYQAIRSGEAVKVRVRSREGQWKVPEREIVVRLITAAGEKEATGSEAEGITIQEK